MARKRKAGARTRGGRLSRANKVTLRDMGTFEAQRKREALVGSGNDPTLSSSALGCLFAYGYIDRAMYDAGLDYRRLHAILYGTPWPSHLEGGDPISDERLVDIRKRFEAKVRKLTAEQKRVVGNVAVFDWRPMWFYVLILNLPRMLPEDEAERNALIDGLGALVPPASTERRAA